MNMHNVIVNDYLNHFQCFCMIYQNLLKFLKCAVIYCIFLHLPLTKKNFTLFIIIKNRNEHNNENK